ncbi:MAG: hypothetical protein GXX86_04225 [Propionibacterium sp.]|nr:hypothetical protein [Propionibacterium sp.]
MKRTRALIALLTLPLLVLLSGCVRYVTDFEIVSPEEVKLSLDFGMQNQAMEEMGSAGEDMCGDAPFADESGATAESYQEDGPEGYSGCKVAVTTTAAELSGDGLTLELADGVWHFTHTGDSEDTEGMTAEDAAQMFSDFRVSVTFPGKVLTHNGESTVDGNTVTWTNPADMFSPDGLQATGEEASAGGGLGGALPWIIGGVVLLVAIGVVLAIVLGRKKKTPPSGGQPYGAAPGQQPGQPGQQQWGQQPGQPDQQWGQQQPGQQWGQQQPGQPGQQWGQQQPGQPGQQWGQQPPNQGYPPQQ